jgi:hypothetical protein
MLGRVRLSSYAEDVLTRYRRSMLMQRMMRLLQVKMDGMLLEWDVLSLPFKIMSAMLDNKASFQGILSDQQQVDEEKKAERAEKGGVGELFSDAEGSVTSDGCSEAAPCEPVSV